jgi:hypothetical protein
LIAIAPRTHSGAKHVQVPAHLDLPVVQSARRSRVRPHLGRPGSIRVQAANRLSDAHGIAWLGDDTAVMPARDDIDFAAFLNGRDVRPSGRQDAVELAGHDESGEAPLQRHDKDVGRGE